MYPISSFNNYLNKSKMLNDVFLYILLYAAFFGFFIHPTPFFPYPGMSAFLTARLTLPVVLEDMDFFKLGILIPNFIIIPFHKCKPIITVFHKIYYLIPVLLPSLSIDL